MDVSAKRSAAEFGANVIARSDDRATIRRRPCDDCECGRQRPWRRQTKRRRNVRTHHGASYRPDGEATIGAGRRCNVVLTSVDVRTHRGASVHCVVARSSHSVVVVARSSHSIVVAQSSHFAIVTAQSSHFAIVTARSSLRAITFVSARCASLRLTSIAPTPLDVHIHRPYSARRPHPSPLLRPQSASLHFSNRHSPIFRSCLRFSQNIRTIHPKRPYVLSKSSLCFIKNVGMF
jgi:hypothetical protein